MFISFSKALKWMGSFRIGVGICITKSNWWFWLIVFMYACLFYLVWYMLIGVGYLVYFFLKAIAYGYRKISDLWDKKYPPSQPSENES